MTFNQNREGRHAVGKFFFSLLSISLFLSGSTFFVFYWISALSLHWLSPDYCPSILSSLHDFLFSIWSWFKVRCFPWCHPHSSSFRGLLSDQTLSSKLVSERETKNDTRRPEAHLEKLKVVIMHFLVSGWKFVPTNPLPLFVHSFHAQVHVLL